MMGTNSKAKIKALRGGQTRSRQNVKASPDQIFDDSVRSEGGGPDSTYHGGTSAPDGGSTKNGSAPLLFESTLGSHNFPKEQGVSY